MKANAKYMFEWIGWIPSMSGDILIQDVQESLEREGYEQQGNKKSYKKQVHASDTAGEDELTFHISSMKRQKQGDEYDVELSSIHDKAIKKQSYLTGCCKVDRNGFFSVYFDLPKSLIYLEEDIARLVYQWIKAIYHQHTHHVDEEELLSLTRGSKKEELANNLLKQYRLKILEYHHVLKDYVLYASLPKYLLDLIKDILRISWFVHNWWPKFPKFLPDSPSKTSFPAKYVMAAQGEMMYATTFVKTFGEHFADSHEELLDLFGHAYNSLGNIRELISHVYQDYTNKILVVLTVALIVFAIIQCFQ